MFMQLRGCMYIVATSIEYISYESCKTDTLLYIENTPLGQQTVHVWLSDREIHSRPCCAY